MSLRRAVRPGSSAIFDVAMPWTIPAHPTKWHPKKKFLLGREVLYRLHIVHRLSPKGISELHEKLWGFTIRPQGVRNYLKAYGVFRPPATVEGTNVYIPDTKGVAEIEEALAEIVSRRRRSR